MSVNRLREQWAAYAPSERRALVFLAGFLLVAALFQGAWSLHNATQRLQTRVAALEQKAALMKAFGHAIDTARAQPALKPIDTASLLPRALELAKTHLPGLPAGALVTDSRLGQPGLTLEASLAFDAWPGFVAALHSGLGMRLVSCTIGRNDNGITRISAHFAPVVAGEPAK